MKRLFLPVLMVLVSSAAQAEFSRVANKMMLGGGPGSGVSGCMRPRCTDAFLWADPSLLSLKPGAELLSRLLEHEQRRTEITLNLLVEAANAPGPELERELGSDTRRILEGAITRLRELSPSDRLPAERVPSAEMAWELLASGSRRSESDRSAPIGETNAMLAALAGSYAASAVIGELQTRGETPVSELATFHAALRAYFARIFLDTNIGL